MEKVEIRATYRKGKGIFALKDFRKGEKVLYISGKVVETDKQFTFPQEIQDHWHPLDKKGRKVTYVLPEVPWMYMNHSCEPNAGIRDRDVIAIIDIQKGEEITIDYATCNIDDWTMKCECDNKNCRKVISTFDKLSPKEQARLDDFVGSYVKKKYIQSSKKN